MYNEITAAVAGTGFIGPVHVEALKRLGVRVKGIMGSTPKKSEVAKRKLGLEVGYQDINDLLADKDIDAVHLAVPNMLHYPMAVKTLEAGKHVMCEKPLAMNTTESSVLVKLARESGLQAAVTYNIRFYPMNLETRARIESGELGRIFSVVGSYVQDWLFYETDYNWRVRADKGGPLRAVADIGTHWIDLVSSMTGLKISHVFADLNTVHPERKKPLGEVQTFSGEQPIPKSFEPVSIDTEDTGCITIRFEEGGQGVLWVSQVTAGVKNRIRYEIAGSKQSISWDSNQPNELLLGHRDKANEALVKDPALSSDFTRSYINYPGGHHEGFPDTFKQCFRSFYDAILGEERTGGFIYPTFEEGHREVSICEAILSSHTHKKWVEIDDFL
ncbi:MAG: Gfo/Idh/MocA family oxidoreductase [Saprospiraceae bacterium]|nr:Gfo/Idh/MocA family oxidoreductase [Saprospiraceae bacterium]